MTLGCSPFSLSHDRYTRKKHVFVHMSIIRPCDKSNRPTLSKVIDFALSRYAISIERLGKQIFRKFQGRSENTIEKYVGNRRCTISRQIFILPSNDLEKPKEFFNNSVIII